MNCICRSGLSVYFDRAFLGVSLNFASLCEGESYTELLSFSSKVKSEERMLCSPHNYTSSAHGDPGLISSPQDPLGKIIALGLFDFLSTAVAVFLTMPLLLPKIEDK